MSVCNHGNDCKCGRNIGNIFPGVSPEELGKWLNDTDVDGGNDYCGHVNSSQERSAVANSSSNKDNEIPDERQFPRRPKFRPPPQQQSHSPEHFTQRQNERRESVDSNHEKPRQPTSQRRRNSFDFLLEAARNFDEPLRNAGGAISGGHPGDTTENGDGNDGAHSSSSSSTSTISHQSTPNIVTPRPSMISTKHDRQVPSVPNIAQGSETSLHKGPEDSRSRNASSDQKRPRSDNQDGHASSAQPSNKKQRCHSPEVKYNNARSFENHNLRYDAIAKDNPRHKGQKFKRDSITHHEDLLKRAHSEPNRRARLTNDNSFQFDDAPRRSASLDINYTERNKSDNYARHNFAGDNISLSSNSARGTQKMRTSSLPLPSSNSLLGDCSQIGRCYPERNLYQDMINKDWRSRSLAQTRSSSLSHSYSDQYSQKIHADISSLNFNDPYCLSIGNVSPVRRLSSMDPVPLHDPISRFSPQQLTLNNRRNSLHDNIMFAPPNSDPAAGQGWEEGKNDLDSRCPQLASCMQKSQESQSRIHEWDKSMGLKRSHSKTMYASRRSRESLMSVQREYEYGTRIMSMFCRSVAQIRRDSLAMASAPSNRCRGIGYGTQSSYSSYQHENSHGLRGGLHYESAPSNRHQNDGRRFNHFEDFDADARMPLQQAPRRASLEFVRRISLMMGAASESLYPRQDSQSSLNAWREDNHRPDPLEKFSLGGSQSGFPCLSGPEYRHPFNAKGA